MRRSEPARKSTLYFTPDLRLMKKNVPKFVLAKNEAAKPGVTYIVHTQLPSFIAEIKTFADIQERDVYLESHSDAECIEVGRLIYVVIKKYFEVPLQDTRKESLHRRLKDWVVANYLVVNVLEKC